MIETVPGWDVSPEPSVHGYTIEWVEPDYFILSRRGVLYQTRSLQERFTRLGTYPNPFWKRHASYLRPVQRLLRHMYYNVIRLPDDSLFLTFGKEIRVYADGEFHPVQGLARPCRVLRSSCGVDQHGHVYFGEYLPNIERGPMRIYRYTPGSRHVDTVYVFPAGSIRHIHGIYWDPYSDGLWCVTGDDDQECRIVYSNDGFRTLETVGAGDETWRCVSLRFMPDAIYYGMDAEFQLNQIYRLDRKTGRRDVLGSVDGPVYYSYTYRDDLFFGVTAEPCPSQQGRSASLWHVANDDTLSRVFSIEKDWLSRYFMFGTLHFPRGPGLLTEFYVHCVALRSADNKTFRVGKKAM